MGGGLGVDYDGAGTPVPSDLAALVLEEIRGLGLKLLLEPGRSLVAPSGALLTRVVATKANGDRRFVITDAGMNDLLPPSLYSAHHRIENLSAPPDA